MKIVHLGAELAPIGKVGGLGDVLWGLSRALIKQGHDVEIIIPKYDVLDLNGIESLELFESFGSFSVWHGKVGGIPVSFIEAHVPGAYFERGKIYGCPDDPDRFAFFCRSALEYLKRSGSNPSVVHLHDWHTAVAAPLIKEQYPELDARVIFTIHNLGYQGHCDKSVLDRLGWNGAKIKDGDCYNLMKGGIVYADHVTTVSPNYANEILTKEFGGSLQQTLKKYKGKLSGILNGIDYGYWNPSHDPFLPFSFSAEKRAGKKKVQNELRKRLMLEDEACPLVTSITRLVHQKGPELLMAALLYTLELGGQFVLLGSAPDQETHDHFYSLKRKLAGSHHVHLELTFNEELSHLVYGASDLFLVPSIFEPCGLTQMIAMRYGAVPLVRETGGLADTVFEEKNGFTFGPPTADALCRGLDRAFETWNTPKWKKLVDTGMHTDFSWDKPAENYLNIYQAKALV